MLCILISKLDSICNLKEAEPINDLFRYVTIHTEYLKRRFIRVWIKDKKSLDLETFVCDLNPKKTEGLYVLRQTNTTCLSMNWECETTLPKIKNKKQQKRFHNLSKNKKGK